jgi:transposase
MENETTPQIEIASPCGTDDNLRLLHDMASLGVTQETLDAASSRQASADPRLPFEPLTDVEWESIAPCLPPDQRQLNTMANREFVNAVLLAMHRGGRWTTYLKTGSQSDAVRRRFGRWAHQKIWQIFEQHLPGLSLTESRKKEFQDIARRAAQLARVV